MATVTVYGSSDDLIEIEGDLREEFSFYSEDDDDGRLLGFSDGTMLRARYDKDGVWRFTLVHKGTAEMEKQEAPANDEENYSDRITLTGDIEWVMFGTEMVAANA